MKTPTARPPQTKATRLNIRTTNDEKALVEQAARAAHMTSSQFVLQAALREAEQVLAAENTFILTPEKWDEFVALLDRPARELPALKKALKKASPFRGA